VCKLYAGNNVADCVDVANAGVQTLVRNNEAAIKGDALFFVAQAIGVRATANSYKNDVSFKYLAVGQGNLCTVFVLLYLLEESTEVGLDAALLEFTLNNLDDCGVLVGYKVRQTFDDGYVYAV
jgi:hypothetical protein